MFVLYVNKVLKRFVQILVFCCVSVTSFAQTGRFHAEFRSLLDGERILYAKITNSSGESKLTNSDGYVNIEYSFGTELQVSHISYDSLNISTEDYKDGDTVLYYLAPRTFTLREFQYSILGPRFTFDNKFIDTDLGKSDIDIVKERLEIIDMKQDLVALDRAAADGVRLGSPITALYEQFSKAGKERRKYAELLARDYTDSLTRTKYNIQVVQSLTAIGNIGEVQDFMDFCSFDQTYIEQTERVEIYFEILRCREEYELLNNP